MSNLATNSAWSRTLFRLTVVLGFLVASLVLFGYFWVNMGGRIPVIAEFGTYQVVFRGKDVNNLVDASEVRIAGVEVGRVTGRTLDTDHARVELSLQPEAALHEGATVRVGIKELLGSSYVEIIDGTGPPIPDGSTLPDAAVLPPVEVHDVINALRPETRVALRGVMQSLGAGTAGRAPEVDQLVAGLGALGREGHTAVDAIALQSEDLKALTREATKVLDTLDTGRGQIATMVRDAQQLTRATSGQRPAIEATVRGLPTLLDSARTASADLAELTGPLGPVAADLRQAAPDLDRALRELPATTTDLRGLLPALDGTLDAAPATLDRIPTLRTDVQPLVPEARTLLQDVNPMLAYVAPYGRDLGAMLANFGASFETRSEEGLHVVRLAPIVDSASLRGYPVPVEKVDPTHWTNPYPKPGQAGQPVPFQGEYPRVERAPR